MKLEIFRENLHGTVDTHGGELISFLSGAGNAEATEYIWNGEEDLPNITEVEL